MHLHDPESNEKSARVVKGFHALHIYATEYWADYVLELCRQKPPGEEDDILMEAVCALAARLESTSSKEMPQDQIASQFGGSSPLRFLDRWPCLQKHVGREIAGRLSSHRASIPIDHTGLNGTGEDSSAINGIQTTLAAYQNTIRALLAQQWVPGVSAEQFDSFKARYRTTAYTCRFAYCPYASRGFESLGKCRQHEDTHTVRLRCEVQDCQYPSFSSKRALNRHVSKHHRTPPPRRQIRRVPNFSSAGASPGKAALQPDSSDTPADCKCSEAPFSGILILLTAMNCLAESNPDAAPGTMVRTATKSHDVATQHLSASGAVPTPDDIVNDDDSSSARRRELMRPRARQAIQARKRKTRSTSRGRRGHGEAISDGRPVDSSRPGSADAGGGGSATASHPSLNTDKTFSDSTEAMTRAATRQKLLQRVAWVSEQAKRGADAHKEEYKGWINTLQDCQPWDTVECMIVGLPYSAADIAGDVFDFLADLRDWEWVQQETLERFRRVRPLQRLELSAMILANISSATVVQLESIDVSPLIYALMNKVAEEIYDPILDEDSLSESSTEE